MQYTQIVLLTLLNIEKIGTFTELLNKGSLLKRRNWCKPKRAALFLLFCSRSRCSKWLVNFQRAQVSVLKIIPASSNKPGPLHSVMRLVRGEGKNNEKRCFLEVITTAIASSHTRINFTIIKNGSSYFCNQSRNNKPGMFLY